MSPELKYLAMTATLTALLWIPYILNSMARNRLSDVVGYPDTPLTLSPWATRLKKAHYNAVENLVVFAALVLVVNAMDISSPATVAASATFFWMRAVHPLAYTFAIPWLRTLAFAVAWAALMCLAWHILM